MDLVFLPFSAHIEGVDVEIDILPTLKCPKCGSTFLPDRSKGYIAYAVKQAKDGHHPGMTAKRKKPSHRFPLGKVDLLYDSDDYYFIPGLERPNDNGFLTPVFFNLAVLLKYDQRPDYQVQFASATYGTIHNDGFYISFGINKNDKVIMWLGDIDKLPKAEQHYLASENVESDHSIGSAFYRGQIEVEFTPPPPIDELFKSRSSFLTNAAMHYGVKLSHLDAEVLKIASNLNSPVIDSPNERGRLADALNKIYIESFDNSALAALMKARGLNPDKLGTLKRLQSFLVHEFPRDNIPAILSPLYTLYDFRVVSLHLLSESGTDVKMKAVTDRLDLPENEGLTVIFDALVQKLTDCFTTLAALIPSPGF